MANIESGGELLYITKKWIGQLFCTFPHAPPPPGRGRGGSGGKTGFKFIVEKSSQNESSTFTYEDNQKKKLIEDIWRWLHENEQLTISIKKKRI